jgi:hypothetical protein
MNERSETQSKDGVTRSLLRNKRGSVAVYLSLAAAIFLPMAAFTIDASRYWGLNTDLKNAAEAAALAAAIAVGNDAASMEAARLAAQNAVDNYQVNANDGGELKIATDLVLFLWALPPAPETNYMDYKTTDPAEVRYVVVRTETRDISSAGMLAFAAWSDNDIDIATKTTTAMAISAKSAQICKVMPLMTCNPVETPPADWTGESGALDLCGEPGVNGCNWETYGQFLEENPQWTRRLMRIKAIGPNEEYGSGVFGLLEAIFTDKGGANAIREEFALGTPSSCIKLPSGTADVQTGQAQAIVQGLNIRWDLWQGTFGNKDRNTTNPDGSATYPVGPGVIKGYLPKVSENCDLVDPLCVDDPNSDPPVTCECTANGTFSYNHCKPTLASFDPGDTITSMGLPHDECFTVDSQEEFDAIPTNNDGHKCYMLGSNSSGTEFDDTTGGNKGFNGRYGNGHWNFLEYFAINHENLVVNPGLLNQIRSYSSDLTGDSETVSVADFNNQEPPSRYAVWLWELRQKRNADGETYDDMSGQGLLELSDPLYPDHIPMPDDAPSWSVKADGSPLEEFGEPQCQSDQNAIVGPDRMLLYIAIVNCMEYADELNNGQRAVPVNEILEAFMVGPADSSNTDHDIGALYVEPIRSLEIGAQENTVLREIIQLY